MKYIYILLFAALLCFSATAAKVETIGVRSASMGKDVKVLVVVPEKREAPASTIYLLHGYSGNEMSWIGIKPDLPEIADRYNVLFVCPDGKNSWYWDSPKDPSYRYETFVAKELVKYIDSNYNTKKIREGRAITGLSMGGHGGLWLGIRHRDTFGSAGSTSGGVDIRPFPKNWEIGKQLGEMKDNPQVWEDHTVMNEVDKLKNGELNIIFDCGFSDFFFDVNNALHQKLLRKKIDHDYLTRPGGHDSKYWNNSIDYQILFFVKCFKKGEAAK